MLRTWTRHHFAAFILTYCIYTIFHASRKAYSDSKQSISQEWTEISCNSSWPCPYPPKIWDSRRLFQDDDSAELFLGLLDTLFLFAYAVGMYFTSFAADRFELRKVLSLGMLVSGVLLFIFGVLTQWFHFYNKAFYAVLWILQGIVQSIGWPACIAVIGNWFGKSGRGLVLGLWSSCASVGNILGNVITAAVIFYGYEYAFLAISSTMFGGGIVIFFGLVSSPEELGLPKPNENETLLPNQTGDVNAPTPEIDRGGSSSGGLDASMTPKISGESDTLIEKTIISHPYEEKQPLSFFSALFLPGVIPYSLSYACLKLVNYAFLFWLPFYLANNFHWDEAKAASVSTWYDVGGIIGGIVCGIISDRLKTRSPVLFAMLIMSPFALWGYKSSPNNVVINSVLMALVGFFINGVSSIISSASAVDLAKQERVGKNGKALATVTGIIDGTGSLGAAIGQYLVAVIETRCGWGWVFNFFIIANAMALLFLLPVLYLDVKQHSYCEPFYRKIWPRRGYSPIDGDNKEDTEE